MPDELEKAKREAEILRRYEEIISYEREFWIDMTGVYDKDDLEDIEFDIIDESFNADLYETDIDDYWAHGWTNEYDYFKRRDAWGHEDKVGRRVFPTRYRLEDFRLSKSLRRVRNKNLDLKKIVRPLRVTRAKETLYAQHNKRLYEKTWENLANMFPVSQYESLSLMETSVFYENKLAAFSVFQIAKYSVLSNTASWDLKMPKRSLGILTVLLEMEYAAKKGFKYYYLSDYTKYNELYQYKTRFPGLEFYDWDNDRWLDAKTTQAAELLDQKLKFHYAKKSLKIYFLILEVASEVEKTIVASAVTGSHAKGAAREDSDINMLILTTDTECFINDETCDWAKRFGSLGKQKFKDRGVIKTIRVFYKNGQEIEFNFAPPSWADLPVNDEARRIVKDGIKILYDPHRILENLQKTVLQKEAE